MGEEKKGDERVHIASQSQLIYWSTHEDIIFHLPATLTDAALCLAFFAYSIFSLFDVLESPSPRSIKVFVLQVFIAHFMRLYPYSISPRSKLSQSLTMAKLKGVKHNWIDVFDLPTQTQLI
jgi:hypothetical protein